LAASTTNINDRTQARALAFRPSSYGSPNRQMVGLGTRSEVIVARRAMPQVRGREQRRGTRNRAARPQREGSNKCTNQKMLGFRYKEVGRTQTGFGRSPCCRPATDQPPLVSCPRATRPQPRSADGATEGPSADGSYDGSESASRQANSREKADSAQRGTHFAEKVVPSETVTDRGGRPAAQATSARVKFEGYRTRLRTSFGFKASAWSSSM
jgi:hypothetical protein